MNSLLGDPFFYIIVVAAGALLKLYVERRISAGVDSHFAIRLEDHKHSLQVASEAAKFDYQRLLAEMNLYSANRHNAAIEVYRSLRVAHGACLLLRGLREELTFEEFDTEDIRDYMQSHDVPHGKQEEVLANWDADRPAVIEDLRKYLRVLEVQLAQNKVAQAQNQTYLNELYFNDEAIEAINSLFDQLHRWLSFVRFPPDDHERSDVPTGEDLGSALQGVHELLRSQLRGEVQSAPTEADLDDLPADDAAPELAQLPNTR